MKGNPVGTPNRQPQPAPTPGLVVTKEVRHLAYRLDIADTPNGRALIVVLPGEQEAHVYDLDDDTKRRLVEGLTGGIAIAGADQLPTPADPQ